MFSRFVAAGLLTCALAASVLARKVGPSAPASYDVAIRYEINARGNDRIVQYFHMVRFLKAIGFVRAAPEDVAENEPEDPLATKMRGSIPAGKVQLLFGDKHVRSARLVATGVKVPEEKDKLVRVDLKLAGGFAADRQRLLADQTKQVLGEIGFKEAIGYDHRGFTRLLGAIPVGQLDALLEDLRKSPGGVKQLAPFQNVSPVLITEVVPNLPPPPSRAVPPPPPAGQARLSPELRALLSDETKAATPTRMEVLLATTPAPRDKDWLASLPDVVVEGQLGQLVTVWGRPADAPNLAAQPNVVGVRLPRTARSQLLSVQRKDSAQPLLASGAARLHAMGHRGKGTRLAVIDGDFRGWEALRGKGLPNDTRLFDLTAERNRSLEPDAYAAGGTGQGTGTRCALAAAQIAPEAELVLLRVDPAAPYMLQAIANAISGEAVRSIGLDRRLSELAQDRTNLELRRGELAAERRLALDDFSPEGEETQQRKDYVKKQLAFDRDERDLLARARRYQAFLGELLALRGIRIVACALVWSEGYPVDGSSALSRSFDDKPFRSALWFQCAGDTRGQAWTGLFRDADGNGVLEFISPQARLPKDSWTPELNFLSWQPIAGARSMDLPAGTRVRVSLQWREPHDPTLWRSGEDGYRDPIVDLHLLVLRQLDPHATAEPADDMEVAIESTGVPLRLESRPNAATYEQVVELRVAKAGRYAVRVEGRVPDTDRPRGSTTLPGQRRPIEVRPRLFVQTLEGTGRAVFSSFATEAASIGMPGDASRVATIGAADGEGKRQPYSAGGPAMNLELLLKPDALTGDQGEGKGGTALAAARAAGLAAAMRSGGFSLAGIGKSVKAAHGGLMRVPDRGPAR